MMPLDILVVNWQDIRNPQGGGAEVHIHEIFRRLVQHGHRVRLVCSNFPGGKREEDIEGVAVIRRGERNTFNWVAPGIVRQELIKRKPSVLVEDINKIPFFSPLYAVGLPIVVVVPHLFGETAFQEASFFGASYVYGMEKVIPKLYGGCRFVVISQSTKEDLIRRGIPGENIRVSLCGIDHQQYFPDFSRKSSVPLVLHVGRLKKYKKVEDVLWSMKRVVLKCPTAKLVIVGAGDYQKSLAKMAQVLQLENVELPGYVPREELVQLLQSAWVVVNTSRKEGWGLTAVEASACGTPVVAYDVPGLRDSVSHQRSGFLVPFGHVEELAQKVLEILQDADLGRRLSRQAVEWAAQFSWERAAREMEEELLAAVNAETQTA